MVRQGLGMLFVALLLSQTALGQQNNENKKIGQRAIDIEAKEWLNADTPVSLAELRGMVVVLYFWVSFHEGGEAILPLMSRADNSDAAGRAAGVYIMGVTSADRKRTEPEIRKAKIFFPVALESKSDREYEVPTFPHVVIIDPEGVIAWMGWPGQGGGQAMIDEINKVLDAKPASRTHPREATLCNELLDETRRHVETGELRQAYASAKKANEHALTGDPLKARCQEWLDLLEEIAQDLVGAGDREVVGNNFGKAVEYFVKATKEFRGLEAARRARNRLSALAKDREEIRTILDEQKKESQALGKLAAAIEQVREQEFADAYLELEGIVQGFGKTEAAEDAALILKRMAKHDAIMKTVRDRKCAKECEPLLSQARNDIRARKTREAKQKLEKIVKEYPETSFADQARKMLIDLP